MGYTSVSDRRGAVSVAAALAESERSDAGAGTRIGLLEDQLMAEAGVAERAVCRAALDQADGDLARACSLVRAWAAVLPRLASSRTPARGLRVLRRITPGFAAPAGGQYLGASLDYSPRLLRLGRAAPPHPVPGSPPPSPAALPEAFERAAAGLEREDLVAAVAEPAVAVDIGRSPGRRTERGALLHLLSRAETGALTAIAYTAIRGYSALQDPTLLELRSGHLPVRLSRPGGGEFCVGEVAVTYCEVGLYRLHGDSPDPRLTLGAGATAGRLERRAISAALLDASCARAALDPPSVRSAAEDPEFLSIALDGQEASGFVEHLKLPHHVTFTSELDRLRQAATAESGAER